ncbi:hypothetical protein P154DRAFT_617322 [Amniculicola lignicola CBS 123094]|uniref:Uncharacterized protein n=1 Tax=Amniculicola lignicola CBS 123094 TaxID=1392246 RepID=A0A6A5WSN1_9PLEO|nr:hypothetical protein P154DRAFT_617322 [Amniculicola lignicola CBS 123094]
MTEAQEPAPPFGTLPWDQYVIEKWDAALPVSKEQQKKDLVTTWIGLGRYGRTAYFQRAMDWDDEVPSHVPQDLLSEADRCLDELGLIQMLWIRTWYGTEFKSSDHDQASSSTGATEAVTRASTDAGYRRLHDKAFLWDPSNNDSGYDDDAIANANIYDNDSDAFGVVQQSADDDVVQVGTMPSFVLSVFMRCPDMLDRMGDEDWRSDDAQTITAVEDEVDNTQIVLAMIIDREAIEDGWVLEVALNHKGQVLPTRARNKASRVRDDMANWTTQGEPLDLGDEPQDRVDYGAGDGWDDN